MKPMLGVATIVVRLITDQMPRTGTGKEFDRMSV
jgi:hypothetical protein